MHTRESSIVMPSVPPRHRANASTPIRRQRHAHRARLPRIAARALIATATAALLVVAGWAPAALAATAAPDAVVNIATDRTTVGWHDTSTFTFTVENSVAVPLTDGDVTLTVPTFDGTDASGKPVDWWTAGIHCTATGGAVCPTGPWTFATATGAVSATGLAVPQGGKLTFTATAQHIATSTQSARASIQVSSPLGDLAPGTNTADLTYQYTLAGFAHGVAITLDDHDPAGLVADVTITNTGSQTFDLLTAQWSSGIPVAAGTAASPGDPAFSGVGCDQTASTGDCAAVTGVGGGPIAATTAGGGAQVSGLQPGRTIVLRVTYTRGTPGCGSAPVTWPFDVDTLAGVPAETDGSVADNTAHAETTWTPPACRNFDLRTDAADAVPAAGAWAPGGPFAYTATYSNAGPDGVTDAYLQAEAPSRLPGAASTFDLAAITCTATGGAVCPASWAVDGSGDTPESQRIRSSAVTVPAGGTLTVTYHGTYQNIDDATQCRPMTVDFRTLIGTDTGTDADSTGDDELLGTFQGNNGRVVRTDALQGRDCALRPYDLGVVKTGPFLDAAGTTPAGTLQPGQLVYFQLDVTNNSVNSTDLTEYSIDDQASVGFNAMYQTATGTSGTGLVPDGITCQSVANGAACPTAPPQSDGDPAYWYSTSDRMTDVSLIHYDITTPAGSPAAMPVGGEIRLTVPFRAPLIKPEFAQCSPQSAAIDANNDVGVPSSIAPDLVDWDPYGNNSDFVEFSIDHPTCTTSLSVVKTATSPHFDADGDATFTITATNTSTSGLEVPRLRDAFTSAAGLTLSDVDLAASTVTCAAGPGASCPSYTVHPGSSQGVDGADTPIAADANPSFSAFFDASWSTPGDGTPTMAPGSSVTFTVTMALPRTPTGDLTNRAMFGASDDDPLRWPTVIDSATVSPRPGGTGLSVTKSVDPTVAYAGETITYTSVFTNYSGQSRTAYLADPLDATLRAGNPSGFGGVACSPSPRATDGVVGATCPTPLASTADGITAGPFTMPAHSSFTITYTAAAPLGGYSSAPNSVRFFQSPDAVSDGDAQAQANAAFLSRASLAGTVFVDADYDNALSAKDTGLPGVLITLTGTDERGAAVTLYACTNASGYYAFAAGETVYAARPDCAHPATAPVPGFVGLIPGTYAVTQTQPDGFTSTTPSSFVGSHGGTAGTDTVTGVTLAARGAAIHYDFGEQQFGSIGDTVWLDSNANGLQDAGEHGVDGFAITLNGTDVTGAPVSTTTTTDSLGHYVFDQLRPGSYTITFSPASLGAGQTFTTQGAGGDPALDSDGDPATGVTGTIALGAGEHRTDIDQGVVGPEIATPPAPPGPPVPPTPPVPPVPPLAPPVPPLTPLPPVNAPGTPSAPSGAPAGRLASTGSDLSGGLTSLALVAVLAGAVLLATRRKRRPGRG